jgi:hypothetical protein
MQFCFLLLEHYIWNEDIDSIVLASRSNGVVITIWIIKVFYLQTDAQVNCFKYNIEIYIKAAPTCFGLITTIRERIISAC